MNQLSHSWRERIIVWEATGQPDMPYSATSECSRLQIRLNDFPAEALYSLMIDGQEGGDFDDWPPCWKRTDQS